MNTEQQINELVDKYKQDATSLNEVFEVILTMNIEDGVKALRQLRATRPTSFREDLFKSSNRGKIYEKFSEAVFSRKKIQEDT